MKPNAIKMSELIQKLQKVMEACGDLPVYFCNGIEPLETVPIGKSIKVRTYKTTTTDFSSDQPTESYATTELLVIEALDES
ncbi:MAG: hypothetical protein SPH18_07915 [Sutterella parvirubra]|mgnify:CR=1 FL=1|nr:hypothetical protein [Sutterella parvirubra]